MTLQEFKAWFDGFTENISDRPSAKQWDRIQARVKEIDGTAISYPVFIDRYWPHHPNIWMRVTNTVPQWQGIGAVGYNAPNMNTLNDGHTVYNSSQAMLALGKADYAAIQ